MAPSHSSTITRVGAAPLIHRAMLTPLICTILGLVLISVFFVWSRQQVLNLQYDIASIESSIRSARQEAAKLQVEVTMLRQPRRIEELARNELGLVMPDPRKIIVIR
jgi:cell division protein FtsL